MQSLKSSGVEVFSGGTLTGDGTASCIKVYSGGILAPGHSPGCLNSGNLTLNGEYQVQIGGTTPCSGYDQMKITGSVDVTGATLTPSLYGGFVPSVGQSYTIISNDGTDAVTGTFANTPGNAITADGVTYSVSYSGGDGNDIVLTVTKVNGVVASATSSSSEKLPGAPNTGFKLVATRPIAALGGSLLSAISLIYLSRRVKNKKVV